MGGEQGGVSPEVHDHLHCFERVKLQVVKTAPTSQLLNLLSVSRLVTVLNEAVQCAVICKLQELDRGVFRCAVVGVDRAVGRRRADTQPSGAGAVRQPSPEELDGRVGPVLPPDVTRPVHPICGGPDGGVPRSRQIPASCF